MCFAAFYCGQLKSRSKRVSLSLFIFTNLPKIQVVAVALTVIAVFHPSQGFLCKYWCLPPCCTIFQYEWKSHCLRLFNANVKTRRTETDSSENWNTESRNKSGGVTSSQPMFNLPPPPPFVAFWLKPAFLCNSVVALDLKTKEQRCHKESIA